MSDGDPLVQSTWLEPQIHIAATFAPDAGELEVIITDYSAPDAPPAANWRALVESIDIDPSYDGCVFRSGLVDAPHKRTAQVNGRYRLAAPPLPTQIAVRITDVWGRETLAVQHVDESQVTAPS